MMDAAHPVLDQNSQLTYVFTLNCFFVFLCPSSLIVDVFNPGGMLRGGGAFLILGKEEINGEKRVAFTL